MRFAAWELSCITLSPRGRDTASPESAVHTYVSVGESSQKVLPNYSQLYNSVTCWRMVLMVKLIGVVRLAIERILGLAFQESSDWVGVQRLYKVNQILRCE